MILTDTLCTAFDKTSMDIMGPLKLEHVHFHYTKSPNQIFIHAAYAIAIEIVNAFVEYFICIYSVLKALLTDQGSNFFNGLML